MFSCFSGDQAGSSGSQGCFCYRPEIQSLTRRINADLTRRGFVAGMGASLASLGLPRGARAQARRVRRGRSRSGIFSCSTESPTLCVKDFVSSSRADGSRLSRRENPAASGRGAHDRLRRPGRHAGTDRRALAHHFCRAADLELCSRRTLATSSLAASAEAERTLMRGFTTVRDLGGPSFALKQAIDDGLVPGPRIYPCGAMITTTGGHGDLRPLSDLPRSPGGPPSFMEQTRRRTMIADSADEVRLRAREQLLQGASQIKLVGGGGVSSPRTALDMMTFSEPEFARGSEAAARSEHLCRRARLPARRDPAGDCCRSQCIEHGHLMDEADRQADGGEGRLVEHSTVRRGRRHRSSERSKPDKSAPGHCWHEAQPTRWPKPTNSRLLSARICCFPLTKAARQGIMLTHLTRWYENAEILKMATGTNGELLHCPDRATPIRGSLALLKKALSPISSWSTAIRSPTSRSSKTRQRIS